MSQELIRIVDALARDRNIDRETVLEDLEVTLAGGRFSDFYPPALPDLFRGAQIVQLGRLEGEGTLTVRISGQVQGQTHVFEREVKNRGTGPEFLPRLWATPD